jgi:thiamine-phosphate pyrophosphorylase
MTLNTHPLAQRILELHADKRAGVSPAPAAQGHSTIEHAIHQALHALGFWPADADIVCKAWLRQSQRLGGFDPGLWPVNPIDFDVPTQPRPLAFAPCPKDLGLYAVLPSADWVARMAQAGVPTLQLRFKSDDRASIDREVKAAVAAVQGSPSLLFINDHWAAAIENGAYGVHLGQEDLSVAPTERIRLAGLRLGLSTHGYAEMLRAESLGPSYLAMGAVFPTNLKRMATPPQGLGRLRVYARLMSSYPLVGIGGIDQSQFAAVKACGVGSVAVVRAIVAQDQPEQAAQALMRTLNDPTDTGSAPR